MAIELGNRTVVGFVTLEEDSELKTIWPIPEDGMHSLTFTPKSTDSTSRVEWFGIESERGQRIAALYDEGQLPSETVEWTDVYPEDA